VAVGSGGGVSAPVKSPLQLGQQTTTVWRSKRLQS
jgi:hypothetical protein